MGTRIIKATAILPVCLVISETKEFQDLFSPSNKEYIELEPGKSIKGNFVNELVLETENFKRALGEKIIVIEIDGKFTYLGSLLFEIEEVKEIKIVGKIDLSRFEKKPKEVQELKEIISKIDVTKFETNKKVTKIILPDNPKEIIHFFKDPNKRIVGRVANGKIAIVDYNYKGEWVKDNEDWEVEITQDHEKKVIIVPLRLVKTSEENQNDLQPLLDQLTTKEWNKPTGRSFSPVSKRTHYTKHKDILNIGFWG